MITWHAYLKAIMTQQMETCIIKIQVIINIHIWVGMLFVKVFLHILSKKYLSIFASD